MRILLVRLRPIGDAGNQMMLDWYEKVFAAVPPIDSTRRPAARG